MSLAGATGAINSQYFLFAKNYWFCWLQVARLKPSFKTKEVFTFMPFNSPLLSHDLSHRQVDRGHRACCHAVSASSGCHAASALEVNYAVTRQIVNQWSNHDKYWCSCSRWHLEFWWYCCSIVIVTAYRLLLVCVYSPLHCTLLPTTDLWQSSGPGPATAGYPGYAGPGVPGCQVPAPSPQPSPSPGPRPESGASPGQPGTAAPGWDVCRLLSPPAQASQATVPAHQHLF